MLEKFTSTIDYFKSLTKKEIDTYKIITIFSIVIDLFGIYWYFELKRLGLALLLILMSFFSVLLFLERNLSPEFKKVKGGDKKMEDIFDNREESENSGEDSDEEENFGVGDFKFSMPTPESIKESLTGI